MGARKQDLIIDFRIRIVTGGSAAFRPAPFDWNNHCKATLNGTQRRELSDWLVRDWAFSGVALLNA